MVRNGLAGLDLAAATATGTPVTVPYLRATAPHWPDLRPIRFMTKAITGMPQGRSSARPASVPAGSHRFGGGLAGATADARQDGTAGKRERANPVCRFNRHLPAQAAARAGDRMSSIGACVDGAGSRRM